MNESVDLDVFGVIHVDFSDEAPVYVCAEFGRIRLPSRYRGLDVNSGSPMPYREIAWIGKVVRRQWSMLIPAVPFMLLGPFWMAHTLGDWPAFWVSAFVFLALGVFPLFIFLRGRSYLGVATERMMLLVPMDRQRKQIGRILGLLTQLCPSETRWELQGTRFADASTLDQRPPSGRGSIYKHYVAITALVSTYFESNVLMKHPRFRIVGIVLVSTVAVMTLGWIGWSIVSSLRWRPSRADR